MTDSGSSGNTRQNKYRPFHAAEKQISHNLKSLLASTPADESQTPSSTKLSGALTMALCYINRESIAYAETHGTNSNTDNPEILPRVSTDPRAINSVDNPATSQGLQSRILVVSVSSATNAAHQYIPIMNTIFACQRLHIPIDIAKLAGDPVFLQQASDATRGVYIQLVSPQGFLQYLMLAFLPDQQARRHLRSPTLVDVDFRAACFCHRKVVDVGFVCSICLSIFCQPPANHSGSSGGTACLTCGSELSLADYGSKPVVLSRRKKRKKVANGKASGTPGPSETSTPAPAPP